MEPGRPMESMFFDTESELTELEDSDSSDPNDMDWSNSQKGKEKQYTAYHDSDVERTVSSSEELDAGSANFNSGAIIVEKEVPASPDFESLEKPGNGKQKNSPKSVKKEVKLEEIKEEPLSGPHKKSRNRLENIPDVKPVLKSARKVREKKSKIDGDNGTFEPSKSHKRKVKENNKLRSYSNTVLDRMKPIGLEVQRQYFMINQKTREASVTRQFLSDVYGDSSRYRMLYLNPDYQPHRPEMPGAPGLWLSPRRNVDVVVKLMTKIKKRTEEEDSRWQYLGQYHVEAAHPRYLSLVEWEGKQPKFYDTWAKAITTDDWGIDVCIRILARKDFGRDPTPEEFEDIKATKRYNEVTWQEVKAAYTSGEEKMGVWTLKCVGYDNDFQLQLHQKFKVWMKELNQYKAKSSVPRSRKRNRAQAQDSDSSNEGDVSEDDYRGLPYNTVSYVNSPLVDRKMGTRSRPIF